MLKTITNGDSYKINGRKAKMRKNGPERARERRRMSRRERDDGLGSERWSQRVRQAG